MDPSNVAPSICSECGRQFPPGAPEPSWCPDCGRLCTGYGESEKLNPPIHDDMPVTPKERARWQMGFWGFLFMGPLFAVLLMLFQADILSSQMGWQRAFAEASFQPILLPCLSAVGAGFCRANARFASRRFADRMAYSFLFCIDVLAAYAGILLIGGIIMRTLMVYANL